MSLFNFFKQKTIPFQKPVKVVSQNPEGDISKTYIVAELLAVPRQARDDQWYQSFYENVAAASFASADPQTLIGPDGFTYFILNTPELHKPFESFCIRNMKTDFLMDRGWGVVFNPAEDLSADWVFTYGAIVNHYLTGSFMTVPDERDFQNIAFKKTVGVIKKAEQVMVAQPSESYLPYATRRSLRTFLQSKGIRSPKVLLLSSLDGERIIRKLALNIPPENYPVTSKLDHLMQQVGWFLPNDYILVPLSEKNELADGFHPL